MDLGSGTAALASWSWLARPPLVGRKEVGFTARGCGGGLLTSGACFSLAAEGGRVSQAGLSVCKGLELRKRAGGTRRRGGGPVSGKGWVSELGKGHLGAGGGDRPAVRAQGSHRRLWRRGDGAEPGEGVGRVAAWVAQVRP